MVTWFTGFRPFFRHPPSRCTRKSKEGYLYALFFKNGDIKVGATMDPETRFSTMNYRWHSHGKTKIALVFLGNQFRVVEKRFHETMRPLILHQWTQGPRETYNPKDKELRALILQFVESCHNGYDEAIDRIARRVDALEGVE